MSFVQNAVQVWFPASQGSIALMCYRLRTLLIVLAVGPPLGAGAWSEYARHCERQRQQEAWRRELEEIERLRRQPTYQGFQLDVF
jgi:hypothetical protein